MFGYMSWLFGMRPRNWKVVILRSSAIGHITFRLVKLLFSILQVTSSHLFITVLSIYPLRSITFPKQVKGKSRLWVLQHCCLEAYCTLTRMSFFIHFQRRCTHQAAWKTSASQGRNYTWNLATIRNSPKLLSSFTCRKTGTWDRFFYFPSGGRHAKDFYARKNPTASAGFEPANLGDRGQHANQ